MKKRLTARKSAVTSHLPPALSHRSWIWHLVPRLRVSGPGRLPWLHRASPSATLDKIDREHCDDAAWRQAIFIPVGRAWLGEPCQSRSASRKAGDSPNLGTIGERSSEGIRSSRDGRRYSAACERNPRPAIAASIPAACRRAGDARRAQYPNLSVVSRRYSPACSFGRECLSRAGRRAAALGCLILRD